MPNEHIVKSYDDELTKLADAGSALPKALQVFLTYPFVDAVVGKNPAVARNLHMGDYTNLSVQLDINLQDLGVGQLCTTVPQLKDLPINICNNPKLVACAQKLLNTNPNNLPGGLTETTSFDLVADQMGTVPVVALDNGLAR